MDALVRSFVSTFQHALKGEIEAIQKRFGASSELELVNPKLGDHSDPASRLYSFDLPEAAPMLVPLMECLLKDDRGDQRVTIIAVDRGQITLECPDPLDDRSASYRLMVFPGFLYQRLQQALASLLDPNTYITETALRLFGKRDAQSQPRPLSLEHDLLNPSQQRAVQLCHDRSLAWIWGPPGTGKTRTLADIVAELLHGNARLLITSATNAAIDQVLLKLAEHPAMQVYFERHQIVRLGQVDGPTFGASVREVVLMRNADLAQRLTWLTARCADLADLIQRSRLILAQLAEETQPSQLGFFSQVPSTAVVDFGPLFSIRHANMMRRCDAEEQATIVARRKLRLEALLNGYRRRSTEYRKALGQQEQHAVHEARLVLATSANVYLSSLLQDERFDVVIVEEAGMVLLPALFFCACLAREKVIVVGDPKQLPAIVQSDDAFVRKYLGKNIFDVAVPEGDAHDGVVMLDVQYRMHPMIGDLVSSLYYQGRLNHDVSTHERVAIAARGPFPSVPLVVVDTGGQTVCARHPGQFSRFNRETARLVVDMAVEGIRNGIASIGIITPYGEQSRLIRRLLGAYPHASSQIECRTVHRFQGAERDMIILDLVDTAPFSPGVLLAGRGTQDASRQLVNVSISRARGKLVIVADVAYFLSAAAGSAVAEMIEHALVKGQRVTSH